jgi:hypothetical protein
VLGAHRSDEPSAVGSHRVQGCRVSPGTRHRSAASAAWIPSRRSTQDPRDPPCQCLEPAAQTSRTLLDPVMQDGAQTAARPPSRRNAEPTAQLSRSSLRPVVRQVQPITARSIASTTRTHADAVAEPHPTRCEA